MQVGDVYIPQKLQPPFHLPPRWVCKHQPPRYIIKALRLSASGRCVYPTEIATPPSLATTLAMQTPASKF